MSDSIVTRAHTNVSRGRVLGFPTAVRAWQGCARMSHFRGVKQSIANNARSGQLKSNPIFHPPEVKMSHASMLKARRKHQKTRKLLDVAAKQAKRLAKLALAGPVVKKEKIKKEKVKKEKVKTDKVKKVKLTKEELGRQEAKKSTAGAGKKGAS